MILDSFKILLIGMGTVFLFLILLVFSIIIVSQLIQPYIHHLEKPDEAISIKFVKKSEGSADSIVTSIISAAVYKYYRIKRD